MSLLVSLESSSANMTREGHDPYKSQYTAYMREVEDYLRKVRNGRSVRAVDPHAPRFSEQADDERQARLRGLERYLPFRQQPPTKDDQIRRGVDAMKRLPGPSFKERWLPNDIDAPASNWSEWSDRYRKTEPTKQSLADKALDIASSDSWMALPGGGAMLGMTRAPGWGAEVLRRYKLLGGTPETLDKALRHRNLAEWDRHIIHQGFRKGTDIAAPAPEQYHTPHYARRPSITNPEMTNDIREQQLAALEAAGSRLERTQPSAPASTGYRTLGERSAATAQEATGLQRRLLRQGENPEEVERTVNASYPSIPSGVTGQAAYGAISSQMGRLMDSPGFRGQRFQFNHPKPISQSEYYKEFPIERADPIFTAPDSPLNQPAQVLTPSVGSLEARLADLRQREQGLRGQAPQLDQRLGPSYSDYYRGRELARTRRLISAYDEDLRTIRNAQTPPDVQTFPTREGAQDWIRRTFGNLHSDERGSFSPPSFGFSGKQSPDPGGFNLPTRKMTTDVPLTAAFAREGLYDVPEDILRHGYMEHMMDIEGQSLGIRGVLGPESQQAALRSYKRDLNERGQKIVGSHVDETQRLAEETRRRGYPHIFGYGPEHN